MNEILLIEDNVEMADLVRELLKNVARVDVAFLRKDVEKKLQEKAYDLYLLDLHLPDCHGYEVFQLIQEKALGAKHVIFLTADASEFSQIAGFNLGSDDYIVKPISPGAFRARIAGKLKSIKSNVESMVLSGGPICIDTLGMRAFLQRENEDMLALDLTPIEFKILVSLIKNKSKVVTRQNLIHEAWGKNVYVGNRVVDQHVASLRKKLGEFQSFIHTIYGSGYRFLVGKSNQAPSDQDLRESNRL